MTGPLELVDYKPGRLVKMLYAIAFDTPTLSSIIVL